MDIESIMDEERYMDLHKDNTEDEILNGLIINVTFTQKQ